jgi:acetyl esterase/lipase
MLLTQTADGYELKDAEQICPLIEGGCEKLPSDVYMVWEGYKPDKITGDDYSKCTTLEFIYKEYPDYSLNVEIDVPTAGKAPYPFIIWVHGGGWGNGSTRHFENQSKYLASRGIAGVRLVYSVTRQGGRFEKAMDEIATVMKLVKCHARDWQFDLKRYGYGAGSAGTPLSSLAAMLEGDKGCILYIGCNGLFDFTANRTGNWNGGDLKKVPYLSNITDYEAISAIHQIPENAEHIPAVVLFHGTADFTINIEQSRAFRDAVIEKGGQAQLHEYEYYVHAFFNRNNSDKFEDVTLKIYDFARKVFGTN